MSWGTFENNLKEAFLNRAGFDKNGNPIDPPAPTLNPDGSVNLDVELLKIAKIITDEYHTVVVGLKDNVAGTRRGFSPTGRASLLASKLILQGAIFGALKLMHVSKIKPNMAVLFPIGSGVTAYWTSALTPGSISPLPMPLAPPYISPITGSTITFPGNPIPVVMGFKKAFSNFDDSGNQTVVQTCEKMARDIRIGFEVHANTVFGIYFGIVNIGIVPTPVPTPWLGMRP